MTTGLVEKSCSGQSTLVNRNITVNGHRTSMRLEPTMWNALDEICGRESLTIHKICSMVDAAREQSSLTAAMRVFILNYFRQAEAAAKRRTDHKDRTVSLPLELIVK